MNHKDDIVTITPYKFQKDTYTVDCSFDIWKKIKRMVNSANEIIAGYYYIEEIDEDTSIYQSLQHDYSGEFLYILDCLDKEPQFDISAIIKKLKKFGCTVKMFHVKH